MGATQSVRVDDGDTEDDEEEEEDDEDQNDAVHGDPDNRTQSLYNNNNSSNDLVVKKVLEQEPEMLPCYASASPLSPQLSSLGTPRLGPSIKVWDPYNVLAPPPPLIQPPPFSIDEDRTVTEVYLICHGECELNLRPDVVGGRCQVAALTRNGKRQARALAVFLNSQGVRFGAVYSSPLDRARSMAVSVCQEMNFAEEHIQSSDAITEMSQGHWEGCLWSEVYTPEITNLIDRFQPDFSAPSGESLRQVEFRMIQFLNGTVLGLPEKLRADFSLHAQTNSIHDRDGSSLPPTQWDSLHRHRPGTWRKKSGKSRLQFVNTTGNGNHDEIEDEISPQESSSQNALHDLGERSSTCTSSSCIGVFTHSVPIRCLLTGLLGCSPVMSHKICAEDSSVTVLQHSWKTGWQVKRLNDTAHLRLL